MKTIYSDEDLFYNLNISSGDSQLYPQDFSTFSVDVFTVDSTNPITYTADDCLDNVLHINSTDLQKLPQGALKIRFRIGIEDETWDDGEFNQTLEKQTGYFLKHPLQKNDTVRWALWIIVHTISRKRA